jgi:benzoyl-CoA reductase/2-hydroxyglutaryl-CoA dehydratase subunit BcrC/BadD/HgdB
MIELLERCGFSRQELDRDLPRICRAFAKLGIDERDVESGKERLATYYDTSLQGVQKILRLSMCDMVNSVLAAEDGKTKLIYSYMTPCFSMFSPALMSKSRDVRTVHHAWSFQTILGCVFGKMVPVLEAAEEQWLKGGGFAHCTNVKTVLGLFALDIIPKPDLLITSGYLCETAPKSLDLFEALYNVPVWSFETCQDREVSDFSESSQRMVALAANDLRRLMKRLQEIVGFEITDGMLWESFEARERLKASVGRLRNLIDNSDPMPLSATHDALYMSLNLMAFSFQELEEAIDAYNTLADELAERVRKGEGAMPRGAPRVLAMLPPNHIDPRLERLVGDLGMALVGWEPGFTVPYEGPTDDPYVKLALWVQDSMFVPPARRIPLIIEACRKMNIAGVIDRYHVGCRTVAGDALMIEKAVGRELGIPALLLEWDNFDSRGFNHSEVRAKLEAFKAMISR